MAKRRIGGIGPAPQPIYACSRGVSEPNELLEVLTDLSTTIDGIIYHDPVHVRIIVRLLISLATPSTHPSPNVETVGGGKTTTDLQNSLLHVNTHALRVHPRPCIADQPKFEGYAYLLTRPLGELRISASSPSRS